MLVVWFGAERDAAAATLERKQADDAARAAQASGLPALEQLRQRHAELTTVTDYSAETIAHQAEATRIVNQVTRHYRDASAATVAEIIRLTQANADLERSIGHVSHAFERVKQSQLRYAEELAALEALRGEPGVDEGLLEIEFARVRAAQVLDVKRAYWEQELLEAEGFRSREAAAAQAQTEQLIAIEYRYATEHGRLQQQISRFAATEGRARAQLGLEIVKGAASRLAAHNQTAFKIYQATAIAQATISTIQSAQDAYASGMKIAAPAPIPQIAAAVFVAAALAEGYTRVAAIKSQPPPQAFAQGGIVDSPTFFTTRHVPRGVAGEAGPEAIVPLKRLPNGQLGVGMQGGGVTHNHVAIAIDVTVTGGADPEATGEAVGVRVRETLKPLMQALLIDEQRPGGLLNPTDTV